MTTHAVMGCPYETTLARCCNVCGGAIIERGSAFGHALHPSFRACDEYGLLYRTDTPEALGDHVTVFDPPMRDRSDG